MTVPDNLNSASNELKILISPQKIVDNGASCSDPCLLQWFGLWTNLMPAWAPSPGGSNGEGVCGTKFY